MNREKVNYFKIRTNLKCFKKYCDINSWKAYSKGNLINAILFGAMIAFVFSICTYVSMLGTSVVGLEERVTLFAFLAFAISVIGCGGYYGIAVYAITVKASNEIKKYKEKEFNNSEESKSEKVIENFEKYILGCLIVGFSIYIIFLMVFKFIVAGFFELEVSWYAVVVTITLLLICQAKSFYGARSLNWNVIAKEEMININKEKFNSFLCHGFLHVAEVVAILFWICATMWKVNSAMNDLPGDWQNSINILDLIPLLAPFVGLVFFYFKTSYFHFFSKKDKDNTAYLTFRDFLNASDSEKNENNNTL